MTFISCFRIPAGKTQQAYRAADRWLKHPPEGIQVLKTYMTLGRWDAVWILEAQSEKALVKGLQPLREVAYSETMLAMPRREIRPRL